MKRTLGRELAHLGGIDDAAFPIEQKCVWHVIK
jgi:hypothetical protein